jgi:sortase A
VVTRVASRVLIVAGLAMLAWYAVLSIDASAAQRLARQSLELAASVPEQPTSVAPAVLPSIARKVGPPVRGEALAALSIPRVQLSAVVLHGSDARTLRRGPGHVENTALPGEPGNIVVAGHRDSFFRPLRHVAVGDDVFLEAAHARVHYRVASVRVVDAHDVSVLAPTASATLTLITCYPFWVMGNAPDRFVVRAIRVDENAAAVATQTTVGGVVSPQAAFVPMPTSVPDEGTERVALTSRGLDNSALIREAIARFRLAYNARLMTHHERPTARPLTFATCDVSVTGEYAVASCGAASTGGEDVGWTFALRHAASGWAIQSIVTN